MLGRQVKCLGGETDIVSLSYHIVDDFKIQFGREEFCHVTGLRFGVDYSVDYKNENDPIPFRRRVFSSAKDANDRDGWDMYPWGAYVWPTLYSQLKKANVKRWHPLYAAEQEKVDDTKAYSVFGFTWEFRGSLPTARLTPDENEIVSNRWVSSRAYFDGCISEATRIPRHDAEREEMYDQMRKFMQGMNVGLVRRAKKGLIIVDQHYGLSDFSGFQSMDGFPHVGPSSLPTQANVSFFKELFNRQRREVRPSMYRRTPYMYLPPTIVLPKKCGDKTKNKGKNANLSPLNLRNAFADDNVGEDGVMIMDERETGNYFVYEKVDHSKVGEKIILTASNFC
nr:hypothetical protein [Tanacetum cinerariifolium]